MTGPAVFDPVLRHRRMTIRPRETEDLVNGEVWCGKREHRGRGIRVELERDAAGRLVVYWTARSGTDRFGPGETIASWIAQLQYRETRQNGTITRGWYARRVGRQGVSDDRPKLPR